MILALLSKYRPPKSDERFSVASLLLVPHKDLAYQYLHWLERIVTAVDPAFPISRIAQVHVRGSSTPLSSQISSLRQAPPNIVIGTPQAILDIVKEDKTVLDLSSLSTVAVDEIDYLIDIVPRQATKAIKKKAKLKIQRHPSPTKQLLDFIYAPRIMAAQEESDDTRTIPRLPQLVLCSATLRSTLRQQVFGSGWIRRGEGLAKVSGEVSERDQALLEDAVTDDEASVLGGRNIIHSALVVSAGGDIKNITGAVEAQTLADLSTTDNGDVLNKERGLMATNTCNVNLPELPEQLTASE